MGQAFDPNLTQMGIKRGNAQKWAEKDKPDVGRLLANRRLGVFPGAFPYGNGFSLIHTIHKLTRS